MDRTDHGLLLAHSVSLSEKGERVLILGVSRKVVAIGQ